MQDRVLLPVLAEFLLYPDPSSVERLASRVEEVSQLNRAVSERLREFVSFARSRSLTELQELFTRTFDLNPVCSLEVGWGLFGEDYRRGRFLAFVRGQLRENGIAESCELPDHLTHLLPLLARLQPEHARRLGREYVGPAVRKMVVTLETERSPFLPVLLSIESVLVSCFGAISDTTPPDIPAGRVLEVLQ